MKKNILTKGYGTFKKSKAYGLMGVIALSAALALTMGATSAYADENVTVPTDDVTTATFEMPVEISEKALTEEEIPNTDVIPETAVVIPEVVTSEVEAAAEVPEAVTEVSDVDTGKQVTAENTVVITHTDTESFNTRADIKIETKVQGEVKQGDYVEYELENLPIGGLNGSDVTIADGTVIGTIQVISEANDYRNEQNNTLANDSEHDQSLSTNINLYSVLRVVFNDSVQNLADISYNISYTNQVFSHLISSMEYTYVSKIRVNGKEVATDIVDVPATDIERPKSSISHMDSRFNRVQSIENGTKLVNGYVDLRVRNYEGSPLQEGSLFTITLAEDSPIIFTNEVGQKLSTDSQRAYFEDSVVNKYNVILNDLETANFEVISNSGKELVVKLLNSLVKTNKFGLDLTADYTPVADQISEDGRRIIGINNTNVTIVDAEGNEIYNTVTNNDYANVTGNDVSADAVTMGRVTIKHVDEEGNDLVEPETSTKKIGSDYTSEAKEIEGYNLVKLPENPSGVYTKEATVVTYVYAVKSEVKYGNVVEIDKTTNDEVLRREELTGTVEVGTAYDTSAQDETIVTADGRRFILTNKADNSVGTVKEGTTEVINVYRELKPVYETVCVPVTYRKTYTCKQYVPVNYCYYDYCGYVRYYTRYEYRTYTNTYWVTEYQQQTRLVGYY